MSGFVPLNAGYTVSMRSKRLNVLVLLAIALAGEALTCFFSRGYSHPETRAIEVSHEVRKSSFRSKFPFLVDLTTNCNVCSILPNLFLTYCLLENILFNFYVMITLGVPCCV